MRGVPLRYDVMTSVALMSSEHDLVPQLIETGGSHSGRVHDVPYGEHIVGRGRGATVSLDDPDVSRQHARLVVAPDGVTVFDLGSKNGVVAQGRRVDEPTLLGHGDTLQVGDVTLQVQHPAAQVAQALAAAGETTATVTNTRDEVRPPLFSLLWPLVGVAVFGVVVAMLLL